LQKVRDDSGYRGTAAAKTEDVVAHVDHDELGVLDARVWITDPQRQVGLGGGGFRAEAMSETSLARTSSMSFGPDQPLDGT